jgi:DNA-binding transcriptional MerR regulator
MDGERPERPMTVGELSRHTGVTVKALRTYTDWGLIYTAGRSPANYRLYDSDAQGCVHLIGELRGLGLTLAQIRDLFAEYRVSGHLRRSRSAQDLPGDRRHRLRLQPGGLMAPTAPGTCPSGPDGTCRPHGAITAYLPSLRTASAGSPSSSAGSA